MHIYFVIIIINDLNVDEKVFIHLRIMRLRENGSFNKKIVDVSLEEHEF